MFVHIFRYRLKCLFKDKVTIFWTMIFPLVLATFFQLALANIGNNERFSPIEVAVVNDENYNNNQIFKTVLNEVSTGEERIFNLQTVTLENAARLLQDGEIAGYMVAENPIRLVVSKSGLRENIIKIFLDRFMQTSSAAMAVRAQDFDSIGKEVLEEVSISKAEPNIHLNYFYSLIAMACFYGSLFGLREVMEIQADNSSIAARINIAPTHKLKAFIYSLCASFFIHIVELLILLIYLIFVLKVDFGARIGYVLLTTIIGSIAGVSFGAIVSALIKKNEGLKIAILITFSMVCSFLAGMMMHSIKYSVSENVPILSYLNPVNLLTDALYSLHFFDSLSRYWLNMALLTMFILVFWFGTYFIVRRRKYASI